MLHLATILEWIGQVDLAALHLIMLQAPTEAANEGDGSALGSIEKKIAKRGIDVK